MNHRVGGTLPCGQSGGVKAIVEEQTAHARDIAPRGDGLQTVAIHGRQTEVEHVGGFGLFVEKEGGDGRLQTGRRCGDRRGVLLAQLLDGGSDHRQCCL